MKPLTRLRQAGRLPALKRCSPALTAVVIGMLIFSPVGFSSQSTLVWDACPDPEVVGYRLHYGNASRDYFPAIDVGNRTSCTVSELLEEIPYYFAVTAYDRYGNESDYSSEVSQTIYENAEDSSPGGWDFCPSDAGGAEVHNVFDDDLQRQVAELRGSGLESCYTLQRNDFTDWNDSCRFVIAWKMKFAEPFRVIVAIETTGGNLRMRYVPSNGECEVSESNVRCGLGSWASDGQWHTVVRNLQSDLDRAFPGLQLVTVKKMLVRGSGRLTDVKLLSTPP